VQTGGSLTSKGLSKIDNPALFQWIKCGFADAGTCDAGVPDDEAGRKAPDFHVCRGRKPQASEQRATVMRRRVGEVRSQPGVIVRQRGDDWILRRVSEDGKVTSLLLSAENILSIVAAAPALQAIIAGQQLRLSGSVQSVHALQIAGIDIDVDALGEILLQMRLPDGLQLTYSCTQDQGRHLAATILACLAEALSDNATMH
jgi:hypothetical protein